MNSTAGRTSEPTPGPVRRHDGYVLRTPRDNACRRSGATHHGFSGSLRPYLTHLTEQSRTTACHLTFQYRSHFTTTVIGSMGNSWNELLRDGVSSDHHSLKCFLAPASCQLPRSSTDANNMPGGPVNSRAKWVCTKVIGTGRRSRGSPSRSGASASDILKPENSPSGEPLTSNQHHLTGTSTVALPVPLSHTWRAVRVALKR